jgi:hypothetical protein
MKEQIVTKDNTEELIEEVKRRVNAQARMLHPPRSDLVLMALLANRLEALMTEKARLEAQLRDADATLLGKAGSAHQETTMVNAEKREKERRTLWQRISDCDTPYV